MKIQKAIWASALALTVGAQAAKASDAPVVEGNTITTTIASPGGGYVSEMRRTIFCEEGTVVYLAGAQTNRPTIAAAVPSGEAARQNLGALCEGAKLVNGFATLKK